MGKVMQKNNQNWQNISQLPFFSALLHQLIASLKLARESHKLIKVIFKRFEAFV
jgi:hypothetical protein